MSIPVITLIGKSGSGKTTLLEKLVVALKTRQYRIATIKHHSHNGFDIDVPGKDSWRFAQAGSDHVIIAAPDKIASYKKLKRELSLEEILPMVSEVDLILAEGYRQAHLPTIEILRSQHYAKLIADTDDLIAIVSDLKFDLPVAQFALEDVKGITDLIEQLFLH
jgi:molybdopterin-guanine dinucleotide biosynthesis protein B